MAYDLAAKPVFEPLPAETWGWSPEMVRLFDQRGDLVPAKVARGVARSDTGQIIGVAGSRYTPVCHNDVIAAMENAFIDCDVDPAGVTRTAEMHENGAKIAVSYTLNRHVIEPKVGDRMKLRFTLRTSHNSTWGVNVRISYLRLVCLNGMVRPEFTAGVYGRHTSGFSVHTFQRQIATAISLMQEDEDRFADYATTRVGYDDARWFFEQTIARRPNWTYDKLVDTLMEQFVREDQTVWGIYNTLTWWSTHNKSTRGAEHNALVRREERVAQALRSTEFRRLTVV